MASVAYLTKAEFQDLTLMPSSYTDDIEAIESGWTDAQLLHWSAWLDSRLGKRYTVPFVAPFPVAIQGWLARIVTMRSLFKRGVDPTDAQYDSIVEDAKDARAEIREAADSEKGLFELPLRADTDAEGITRGAPLGYNEVSPYTWTTEQRLAAQDEP